MDLSQLPDRLGATVDELRDRTASAVSAEGASVHRELRRLGSRLDGLGEAVEHVGGRLDRLSRDQEAGFRALTSALRRTSWPRRLFWVALGLALGAGASYLADPDRGRARRSRLSDQLAARTRDLRDEAAGQLKDKTERAKGAVVETAKDVLPEDVPEDLKLLEQRVRSHALGGRDDAQDVIVRVDGPGQVALKGTVPTRSSEQELLGEVAEVEGVTDVRSELTVRAG